MQKMTLLIFYSVTFISWGLLLIPQTSLGQVDYSLAPEGDDSAATKRKAISAFIGKGENGGTGVYKPGTYSYSLSPSTSESGNGTSTKQSVELKVKYGVNLFGENVELDCTTPWTVERKAGQNSESGFESLTCGAKIQVYNNKESGTSASVKMSLKDSNIWGHGLSEDKTGTHLIIPVAVLKLLADGDAAVVGTVTLDQALNGSGTQMKYAAGAGTRLSQTSSVSGDISYTNKGKATVDGIYGYQISNSTLFWVKLWRSVTHSSGSNETGIAAGIEVTLDRVNLTRTKCLNDLCLK